MNPWHDIETHEDSPKTVIAVIEVPKGSKNKYELHKKTGMIQVDRVLYSAMHYPANYGFIPETYCEDNDPLDILVLGQEPVYPLSIMDARPIGLMNMIDQGEADDKIIAVHVHDPEYRDYHDIADLPQHRLLEIRSFFEQYKTLEGKTVQVDDFLGAEAARKTVKESVEAYKKKFPKK